MQHVGGEILHEFANGVFERSPPTLILVPAFIQKETKMETNKDSTGFESLGSLHFIEMPKFILFLLIFFFVLFYCSHIYFFIFFMAKV